MFNDSQKGVSLIITFFMMIIILAVVLFISVLLYSEVKIIRNVGDSMVSFFAADSGVEKVLYYDRKVLPTLIKGECPIGTECDPDQTCSNGLCTIPAKRGLCSMYTNDSGNNPNYCASDPNPLNPAIDHSIYCSPDINFTTPQIYVDPSNPNTGPQINPTGCDPNTCNDCQVFFNATFDKRNYYTKAEVYPSEDGKSSDFQIESKGVFGGSERQVEILISLAKAGEAIAITDACAIPNSNPQGTAIAISVNVSALSDYTVGSVTATIHDSISGGNFYGADGNIVSSGDPARFLSLSHDTNVDPINPDCPSLAHCDWNLDWSTSNLGSYYVDIEATDASCTPEEIEAKTCVPNKKSCTNIQSAPACYISEWYTNNCH